MSEEAEIVIKVKGPYAEEVVGHFWAWFLDAAGAQMFCEGPFDGPIEDNNLAVYDTYDKENEEWILIVEEKEE